MTDKLTTASVLAFERKLDPSDAVFHAGRWDNRAQSHAWQPVAVRAKSVRGTISNRLKAKDQDPAKLDAAIENPNLQTVDVAALPAEADTLKVQFTLRVLGGAGTPSACNSAAYQAKLLATVQGYVQQQGFGELARRYAANLANGRFLWRNRAGAEQVEVTVEQMQGGQAAQQWSFDALALNTRAVGAINTEANGLDELGQAIATGLAGSQHLLLRVLLRPLLSVAAQPPSAMLLFRWQSLQTLTSFQATRFWSVNRWNSSLPRRKTSSRACRDASSALQWVR